MITKTTIMYDDFDNDDDENEYGDDLYDNNDNNHRVLVWS